MSVHTCIWFINKRSYIGGTWSKTLRNTNLQNHEIFRKFRGHWWVHSPANTCSKFVTGRMQLVLPIHDSPVSGPDSGVGCWKALSWGGAKSAWALESFAGAELGCALREPLASVTRFLPASGLPPACIPSAGYHPHNSGWPWILQACRQGWLTFS